MASFPKPPGQDKPRPAPAASEITHLRKIAGQAGAEAREAHQFLDEFARAAAAIAEVVSVIDGISASNRLLAVTAGVEARRPGDAGPKLARLVDEVEALAATTATALHAVTPKIARLAMAAGEVMTALERFGSQADALMSALDTRL
jgi:methyl-accepting chemotaxis protein